VIVQFATNSEEWELFLTNQQWSPFLQSWVMGEVYRTVGEEPIRLEVRDGGRTIAICQAIMVSARRGKHLAVLYGPVLGNSQPPSATHHIMKILVDELQSVAREMGCAFVRISPFWPIGNSPGAHGHAPPLLFTLGFRTAPLHMLAEHVWYMQLEDKTEDQILGGMRSTTRNLIRRSEKEGVTVRRSHDPLGELSLFFELYDETRKRHHFVPYSEEFIRAQVEQFSGSGQDSGSGCALYIARYNGEPVAASVHMIYGGETSYHHGASSGKYPKCHASYLLQWRAICDALKREDRIYNFWGIAPEGKGAHPFSGVTTFKTGFGGETLELVPCMDLPLSSLYWKTWGIESVRKWKRGF
jgi:lipid II:glycine glycyltransferase (peptidoglycan interpeptide bridge formation enzyme)